MSNYFINRSRAEKAEAISETGKTVKTSEGVQNPKKIIPIQSTKEVVRRTTRTTSRRTRK